MPRKLFDIEINEITLCKSPANRKKFFIKKMEEKNMTFIDKLKKFLAEADEDVESTLTKEQVERIEKLDDKVQKEIEAKLDIVSQYEDIPDDLEDSIQFFVKKVSYDYPVVEEEIDKAGAKLSKTTQAQIATALGHIKDGPKAIDILKTLLGLKVKKEEEEEEKTDGEEKISPEIQAKLEKLAELEKAEKERLEKESEKKQKEDIQKMIDERLEQLELKEKPTKKSIDGQEDDEKNKGADDEEEDDFPSIPLLVKN